MKLFIVGLVLGLNLAALGVWADFRMNETRSEKNAREALEFPVDQYGNVYDNDRGTLTPIRPHTRRGPC